MALDLSLGSEGLVFPALIRLLETLSCDEFQAACPQPYLLQIPLDHPTPLAGERGVTQRVTAVDLDQDRTSVLPPEAVLTRTRSRAFDGVTVHRLAPRETAAPGTAAPTVVTIGRAGECDVVLRASTVSQRHAQIDLERSTITDLGSLNGTFVESKRIPPRIEVPISDGQNLWLASYRAVFLGPARLYRLAERLRPRLV